MLPSIYYGISSVRYINTDPETGESEVLFIVSSEERDQFHASLSDRQIREELKKFVLKVLREEELIHTEHNKIEASKDCSFVRSARLMWEAACKKMWLTFCASAMVGIISLIVMGVTQWVISLK
jgi:hypothetical protein